LFVKKAITSLFLFSFFFLKLVPWSWSNESLLICRRSKSTQSAQPLYLRLSVPNLRTAPKRNKGQTFPHGTTLLTPLPIEVCRIAPFRLSSPICHVLVLPPPGITGPNPTTIHGCICKCNTESTRAAKKISPPLAYLRFRSSP